MDQQVDGSQVAIEQENLGNNDNVVGSEQVPQEPETLLPSDRQNINIDEIKANIGLPDYIVSKMSEDEIIKYNNEHQQQEPTESQQEQQEVEEHTEQEDSGSLWQEVEAQVQADGGISEEVYDKLNKLGVPDEVIDNYIDGMKAKQDMVQKEITSYVGGEEKLASIIDFATAKYGEEFVENASNMPTDQLKLLLSGIKAEMGSDENVSFNRLSGNSNVSSSQYQSQQDYLLDVKDSRYGRDEKYTKMVDDKFKRSKL